MSNDVKPLPLHHFLDSLLPKKERQDFGSCVEKKNTIQVVIKEVLFIYIHGWRLYSVYIYKWPGLESVCRWKGTGREWRRLRRSGENVSGAFRIVDSSQEASVIGERPAPRRPVPIDPGSILANT